MYGLKFICVLQLVSIKKPNSKDVQIYFHLFCFNAGNNMTLVLTNI